MRLISSQLYLGPLLLSGGKLISVVDHGWGEIVSGKGVHSFIGDLLTMMRYLGHGLPTYLILVGVVGLLVTIRV